MAAALAIIFEQEQTQARADERRYRCDLCHTANGVQFADTYWACPQCAERIFLRLRWEQWTTSAGFSIRRKKR